MKKEMLINVLQPEECRIAIVEDGVLEELYVERTSHESYTGNIYKGRIVDIEPQYYRKYLTEDAELGARDRARDPRRDRDRDRYRDRDEPRFEERGPRS